MSPLCLPNPEPTQEPLGWLSRDGGGETVCLVITKAQYWHYRLLPWDNSVLAWTRIAICILSCVIRLWYLVFIVETKVIVGHPFQSFFLQSFGLLFLHLMAFFIIGLELRCIGGVVDSLSSSPGFFLLLFIIIIVSFFLLFLLIFLLWRLFTRRWICSSDVFALIIISIVIWVPVVL